MKYSKGDRVFTVMAHKDTGEKKLRYGTVDSDEIEGWDYINVKFDDFPAFPILVVAWYLFKDGDDYESPSIFDVFERGD